MRPFTTFPDLATVLGQTRDAMHNVGRYLIHPEIMPETKARFRTHLTGNLPLLMLFAPVVRSAGYSPEQVRGITKALDRELREDTQWILITEKGGVETVGPDLMDVKLGDFLASYRKSGTDLKIFNVEPMRKIAAAAIDLAMSRYFPDGAPPKAMADFQRSEAKKKVRA